MSLDGTEPRAGSSGPGTASGYLARGCNQTEYYYNSLMGPRGENWLILAAWPPQLILATWPPQLILATWPPQLILATWPPQLILAKWWPPQLILATKPL